MNKNKILFQYTGCNLDYIYLLNGYEKTEDGYIFQDLDGLHQSIADYLIEKKSLTGPEVKYIRIYLGFSQKTFASLLHDEERNIRRWESGECKISELAEEFIKRFVYEKLYGECLHKDLLEKITLSESLCYGGSYDKLILNRSENIWNIFLRY